MTGSVAQLLVIRVLADVCIVCAGKLFIYYAIINLGAVFITGGADIRALRAAALEKVLADRISRQALRGLMISLFHGPLINILLILMSPYFQITTISAIALGFTAWELGIIRIITGILKGWGKAHAAIIVEFVLPPVFLLLFLIYFRNYNHLEYEKFLASALLSGYTIASLMSSLVLFRYSRSSLINITVSPRRLMASKAGPISGVNSYLKLFQSYVDSVKRGSLYFITQFNTYLWASVPYLFMPMLNFRAEDNVAFGVAHRIIGLVSTIGQAVGIHFSRSFVLADSGTDGNVNKIMRFFSQALPLLVVAVGYDFWVCSGLGICSREIVQKSVIVFVFLAITRLVYALMDFPDLRSVLQGKPLIEVMSTLIALFALVVSLVILHLGLKSPGYISISASLGFALVLRSILIQFFETYLVK